MQTDVHKHCLKRSQHHKADFRPLKVCTLAPVGRKIAFKDLHLRPWELSGSWNSRCTAAHQRSAGAEIPKCSLAQALLYPAGSRTLTNNPRSVVAGAHRNCIPLQAAGAPATCRESRQQTFRGQMTSCLSPHSRDMGRVALPDEASLDSERLVELRARSVC